MRFVRVDILHAYVRVFKGYPELFQNNFRPKSRPAPREPLPMKDPIGTLCNVTLFAMDTAAVYVLTLAVIVLGLAAWQSWL